MSKFFLPVVFFTFISLFISPSRVLACSNQKLLRLPEWISACNTTCRSDTWSKMKVFRYLDSSTCSELHWFNNSSCTNPTNDPLCNLPRDWCFAGECAGSNGVCADTTQRTNEQVCQGTQTVDRVAGRQGGLGNWCQIVTCGLRCNTSTYSCDTIYAVQGQNVGTASQNLCSPSTCQRPTPTPTPTPTPVGGCNNLCLFNFQCNRGDPNRACINNHCRLMAYPNQTNCQAPPPTGSGDSGGCPSQWYYCDDTRGRTHDALLSCCSPNSVRCNNGTITCEAPPPVYTTPPPPAEFCSIEFEPEFPSVGVNQSLAATVKITTRPFGDFTSPPRIGPATATSDNNSVAEVAPQSPQPLACTATVTGGNIYTCPLTLEGKNSDSATLLTVTVGYVWYDRFGENGVRDPNDPGANGCSKNTTVTLTPTLSPWLQTTGGDVHSNVNINTPGGP